ncbi:MAG TPA: FadR/GntR family transcriptional regulator [Burkholderiaceae bacterium]|nr:FadR/GntR family transcriptional regulator [Burkholderiaceae bacterium]HNB46816.1 FadR/GntR family transcriptional regulator [Burkholderiaceae bacterium]HNG79141.1 FadR/GntR family transcriptional regulator [Burkholderiaceae bacterium]
MNETTPAPNAGSSAARRRPRSLAHELVEALGERIRNGQLAIGAKLPTEAAVMAEFGVSRTVVREALSKLQAAGLVETRHGIGTFVVDSGADAASFRIDPQQLATLRDVVAVLELRIGVETEAAGLAAQRRSEADLQAMREALNAFSAAIEAGRDAVTADFLFHTEVARATQNAHFSGLLATLGVQIIPRARLDAVSGAEPAEAASPAAALDPQRLAYLRRVHAEHESIYDAIAAQDADAARAAMRTHLANSRERRRRAFSASE